MSRYKILKKIHKDEDVEWLIVNEEKPIENIQISSEQANKVKEGDYVFLDEEGYFYKEI